MSNILKLSNQLKEKSINKDELINDAISKANASQETYNPFVTIINNPIQANESDNALAGIPYAIKDNFSTKGILSTGSSKTLKDYIPCFDATVVERLNNLGAINIGKTVLDEFGMGGTGTTGHTGIVHNPWDKLRIAGGSSAGSACAVALGIVPFALGSDTGDSVRKPASYCGIVGYKPTYGILSRYGLFPYASSLDHVGVLSRNVMDAAIVVNNIMGHDPKDMTSINTEHIDLVRDINDDAVNKKLFYIKEIIDAKYDDEETISIITDFHKTIDKVRNMGIIVDAVSFDEYLLNAINSTYVCISCAEATSNMSNLTGIIFGPRGKGDNINDMIKDYRTIGFSPLIKRRFIIGSYVLQKENQEKYYLNACRIRKLVVDKMNDILKNYDGLIMPTSSKIAPYFDQVSDIISKNTKPIDSYLDIANFGGFPSISIPNGFYNHMPTGINITSRVLDDANLLQIANKIEEVLGYKDQVAGSDIK